MLGTTAKATSMMHYQLTDAEHAQVSEAKRNGAVFEVTGAPMMCRTGDGHATGTHNWSLVTCPTCRVMGQQTKKLLDPILLPPHHEDLLTRSLKSRGAHAVMRVFPSRRRQRRAEAKRKEPT